VLDVAAVLAEHRPGKAHFCAYPERVMAMLRKLAGDCSDGVTCPAVYLDDEETVIVQGYEAVVTAALPPPPDGEVRVRLPRSILLKAVEELA
jgi:hypothetical protein